jgi:hypothetical protein
LRKRRCEKEEMQSNGIQKKESYVSKRGRKAHLEEAEDDGRYDHRKKSEKGATEPIAGR